MEVTVMLISPSLQLGSRVERLDDGYWHVKSEYKATWTKGDQDLLDRCNETIKEYRKDRSKFVFDDDIE